MYDVRPESATSGSHLLETPRLVQRRREIAQLYRAAASRPRAHAGLRYPVDAEAPAASPGVADGNPPPRLRVSAIYTVPRALAASRGRLLAYTQGEDPADGLVGFGAAVLSEVNPDDGSASPHGR